MKSEISVGSCNWSYSVSKRWNGGMNSKPFEAQNPALEWNMKKDIKTENEAKIVYPLLTPTGED